MRRAESSVRAGGSKTVNKAKLEVLSQKLEQLKALTYECPGPTREVSEEVKSALEAALNEVPVMNVVRCIELNCMACEVYDEHAARVDEVEEELDALYEEDSAKVRA
jgi:predicted transcriptional regulator